VATGTVPPMDLGPVLEPGQAVVVVTAAAAAVVVVVASQDRLVPGEAADIVVAVVVVVVAAAVAAAAYLRTLVAVAAVAGVLDTSDLPKGLPSRLRGRVERQSPSHIHRPLPLPRTPEEPQRDQRDFQTWR
jgi:hypothetical protein